MIQRNEHKIESESDNPIEWVDESITLERLGYIESIRDIFNNHENVMTFSDQLYLLQNAVEFGHISKEDAFDLITEFCSND